MNYNEIYQKLMDGVSQDEIAEEIAVEFNRAVEDYEKFQNDQSLMDKIDETADCCADDFNNLFEMLAEREGLNLSDDRPKITGSDIIDVINGTLHIRQHLNKDTLNKILNADKSAKEKKNLTFEDAMQDFFNIFGL